MDKNVKQATFRSVVSSGHLKCTKTEIFHDEGGSDDRSHSTSAQSLTHHRRILVSKHVFGADQGEDKESRERFRGDVY